MKKLFVLVSDSGDGSYSVQYTMNAEWIALQEEKDSNGAFEYDGSGIGVDGDGFHYDTLTVPDDATLTSLGIRFDCAED